jgi:phage-related protein
MVINKFFDVRLYQESSGKVPILEWLKDFNKDERKIIDRDIKYTQYTWPWKMPLIKPLGGSLMEIRIKLKNKQVRIFFILHEGVIMLLHGFVKKTQKTPNNELELALKRAKQIKKKQ